jgi:hypothetical protein
MNRVAQSLYSDWATVWGSNPGGGEIFRNCPDRPWVPPSLLYNGYRVFPGVKSGRGVTLTPHPLLVPLSWKGRFIPVLSLWAVRPLQSLSACTRVHFTFFYVYVNIHVLAGTLKRNVNYGVAVWLSASQKEACCIQLLRITSYQQIFTINTD